MAIEFKSAGDFAKHLKKINGKINKALLVAVDACALEVENSAKSKLGTYQPERGQFEAWAPLAARTIQERIELGFTPNEPLLRTGHLRDSISHKVEPVYPNFVNAVIGSDCDYALIQEIGGTTPENTEVPPRSFLGMSLFQKKRFIKSELGTAITLILKAKPYTPNHLG